MENHYDCNKTHISGIERRFPQACLDRKLTMQKNALTQVRKALKTLGFDSELFPYFNTKYKHSFLTRHNEGAVAFLKIGLEVRVIVMLNLWAYAQHVSGLFQKYKGTILLLTNFDGTYPGLAFRQCGCY